MNEAQFPCSVLTNICGYIGCGRPGKASAISNTRVLAWVTPLRSSRPLGRRNVLYTMKGGKNDLG